MHIVDLPASVDFDGWRNAARDLLQAGVPPEDVHWPVPTDAQDGLFAAPEAPKASDALAPTTSVQAAAPRVPPAFLTLAQTALLHSDPQRFALLYRLLWRHTREPNLRHDALDPDVVRANTLAQSVRRDMHKMKAFVRFNELQTEAGPRFVAWFEPDHHIVDATAPFFARRFTTMLWTILTPRRSVHWDGHALVFGPGARRSDAPPEDQIEALWLTYYENIFNPARLKLDAMRAEMPQKYWRNLPEARLIAPLTARAHERADVMVREAPSAPNPRTAAWVPIAEPARALSELSIREQAAGCLICPHAKQATQTVWGEGPTTARLMFVGEQPGDEEDLHGRPFVGPAGRLFNAALEAASLSRDEVYLTNAVKHFKFEPQGKRRIHKTPGQREMIACRQWLEHEVAQVTPRLVVALGATAAQTLVGRQFRITQSRGEWFESTWTKQTIATFHPSAILRSIDAEMLEKNKALFTADLAKAAEALRKAG
jgi:DNA polymerase